MSSQKNNTDQKNATRLNKNWIYGVVALIASILGFFFWNSSSEEGISIGEPIAAVEAEPMPNTEPTPAEPTLSPAPDAPGPTPPNPVDHPPKPKPKTSKKQSVAMKPAEPMKYNPDDFKPNDFYENMPASKAAISPAVMQSPTDNALILPDSNGEYRFQLAVELSAEKDDRLAIFPNNKAAFDHEKPLWRIVFPDTHSGLWKQFIKLDGKPGLYYVVLNSGGTDRVVGKFVLN